MAPPAEHANHASGKCRRRLERGSCCERGSHTIDFISSPLVAASGADRRTTLAGLVAAVIVLLLFSPPLSTQLEFCRAADEAAPEQERELKATAARSHTHTHTLGASRGKLEESEFAGRQTGER